MSKTILIVGTFDTKDDELRFVEQVIIQQGGAVKTMDVSILHDPTLPTNISKNEVAQAAKTTIADIIALEDENAAMQAMALGASLLTLQQYDAGLIDGILVLGGTMGTDLALDVCHILPIGVPKYIVSTVAFSPMLPPERIPADVQMILWAGGLYGLNSICKATLSQAAGAVLGAAKATQKPDGQKPLIGMTSFGKTVTRFMVDLKPALEDRGYEVAVFHPTGMGGRAFEYLAAQGRFVCVLDLATQEVGNHLFGSQISAGSDRLTHAGATATPQIIAAGCYDLVDVITWRGLDERWDGYESHVHNRLLTAVALQDADRVAVAKAHAEKINKAKGKTAVVMPMLGCNEWDRQGNPLHSPNGVQVFADALQPLLADHIAWYPLDGHINDAVFVAKILAIFDDWFGH